MDLATLLSKFQIQEFDQSYFLYSEDENVRYNLINFLNPSYNTLRYTFKLEHNHIIINSITYNYLVSTAFKTH